MVMRLREEGMSLKDAVKQVAKDLGLPRNQLYDMAVNQK
jgi:16S rRNA (cytidine1402-2'-O)-methyltransferase